jgi:hypothetical protein
LLRKGILKLIKFNVKEREKQKYRAAYIKSQLILAPREMLTQQTPKSERVRPKSLFDRFRAGFDVQT